MFFFQVLFSLFLTVFKGHVQLLFFRGRVFHGVFWSRLKVFRIFFVWNLQTVFPLKPMFSKDSSFFVLLFVIMGIDFAPARGTPASVSDHVRTSQDYIKVNMSGLDFLALVLQNFNSFDLNVFFQVLFSLFLTVFKGHVQLLFFRGRVFHGVFWSRLKVFRIFFVWNLQTVFPLKPMFSKDSSFFVLLFVIMGIDFAPARGTPASVSDHVRTSQDYIKVNMSGLDFLALVL